MASSKTLSTSPVLAAAIAAATLVPLRVPAATPDDKHTEGVVDFGINGYAEGGSTDSAKFREFQDVPDGLVVNDFSLDWEARDALFGGGTFLDVNAFDAVQKDQRYDLTFGSHGKWKGVLGFTENPRLYSDTARQLWSNQGKGVFTLDDSFQAAMAAAPAAADADSNGVWDAGTRGAIMRDAVAADAHDVSLGYVRKTGFADFTFTPNKTMTFGIALSRERREGTRPEPLVNGFDAPGEVAAPVNWTTDWLKAFVEASRKHWMVGASYGASRFRTGQDSLTWDNQLSLVNGPFVGDSSTPGVERMSLGTDNDWHQWEVYGAGNLPGHTRINFDVSQASTTQDDNFLPYTINPNIPTDPLPAVGLNGKIDNNLYDLRINTRPVHWFHAKAWARRYEQRNKTPMLAFTTTVNYDTTLDDSRVNLPLAYYEKTDKGAEVDFEPAEWANVGLQFDRQDIHRRWADVLDSSENGWKLFADFDVTRHLFLRASAAKKDRNAQNYDMESDALSFPVPSTTVAEDNEGDRHFLWTDRKRDELSLRAEITVNEKLAVYLEGTRAFDTYFDPLTGQRLGTSFQMMEDRGAGVQTFDILLAGRTRDEDKSATLGFNITPNDRWRIYVDHTWEWVDLSMASRYRNIVADVGTDNPLDNWFSRFNDRYRTLSLGFSGKWAQGAWSVDGTVSWSTDTGDIFTTIVPGGAARGDTTLTAFPQIKDDYHVAKLRFERHLDNGWDFGIQYWYELWRQTNWNTNYDQPYMGNPTQDPGMATAAFLGLNFKPYENQIVQVFARYHF